MVVDIEIAEAFGIAGLFLCMAMSATGTAIGMMKAARAGVGVLSEEPRYFSSVLLLTFLPATQLLVYGSGFTLLVAGAFPEDLNLSQGVGLFALSAFVGVAQLFSAYGQGTVCADTIVMLPKTRGAALVRGLVLVAYLEFVGLLGLVFGYMFLSYALGG
ncbi:MAG: hypothetical protein QXN05_03240 [Acidilobaceae archaeon]